jgi:hypothetical protein
VVSIALNESANFPADQTLLISPFMYDIARGIAFSGKSRNKAVTEFYKY